MSLKLDVALLRGEVPRPRQAVPWKGHKARQVNYRARVAWRRFKPRFDAWMLEWNPP